MDATAGFLLAGPLAGFLSDRLGAKYFATGGMIGAAVTFILLMLLPVNFSYWIFALILLVNGLSMMSPCGPREKQALLEAPDLKSRAEMLVAITTIELARGQDAATQIH